MIKFTNKGDFSKTDKFFSRLLKYDHIDAITRLAEEGVKALRLATPIDSGLTADSWGYEIETSKHRTRIIWTNSNINDGVPVAIILQYGHSTGTGGYVQGIDYINPAIQPVFDKISDEVWKEVVNL